MAILLNLALFCIFGVLQVSCEKACKYIELTPTVKELKCCYGILQHFEESTKVLSLMKVFLDEMTSTITVVESELPALHRSGCGKGLEDKKSQEEVSEALKKIIEVLLKLLEGSDQIIPDLLKLINTFSFAMNDQKCICKNYACVQKIEYPDKKAKEPKECKEGKCNKELREVYQLAYGFLSELIPCFEMYQLVRENLENVSKMKDEIQKDTECKDEKLANEFKEKLSTGVMYHSKANFRFRQLYLYGIPNMLKACQEGLKAITACGKCGSN